MNVLAEHIGHRCVLQDERKLRCVDCARTLVLPAPSAGPGSTSTSKTPPTLDKTCPVHLGWADACAGCAADRIATDNGRPRDSTPIADVAAGAAAARAALAAVAARRTTESAHPRPTSPAGTTPTEETA